jgi:hypothetical protein
LKLNSDQEVKAGAALRAAIAFRRRAKHDKISPQCENKAKRSLPRLRRG